MDRAINRASTLPSILLVTVLVVSGMSRLGAQEIGGYAWSFLKRMEPAREIAMAGAFVPYCAGGSAVFSNGAALALEQGTTATLSTSFLPLSQRFDMAGIAFGVGDMAGIGFGMVRYGISDVKSYNSNGQFLGLTGSQEFAISAAGGLRIGPGAVGATVRYLLFDPQSAMIEGTSGYTMDLSGMLEFEGVAGEHDWLFATASINNLAGEQKGPSRLAAANARLGGAYLFPLQEGAATMQRRDPTGIVQVRREKPAAYVMAAVEIRTAQYDPLPPSIGIAGEWALAQAPVGVRLGWNTRTDFSAGFFVRWPENLVIDVAATRDNPTSSPAGAATLTFTF